MKKMYAVVLLVLFTSIGLHAENASSESSSTAHMPRISLGDAVVPLTGPWKFHVGDNPQWASPDFDDSGWEAVDLTPKQGSFDPTAGFSGYVPGWTAKGHPGYSGYAWYRIRVSTAARPGEKLALAGPSDVDDAYQVFANGRLLGSFGKFTTGRQRPVVYNSRPAMFPLPQAEAGRNGDGATQVLAFRVWMEPTTLTFEPDAGGMKSAPLLGEAGVVAAQYQLAWLERIRSYTSGTIEAALFFLLAIVACSLFLFDRSDPVYLWLAGVFLLTAIVSSNVVLASLTQIESGATFNLVQFAFLYPLVLGGWVMVWWVWFRLRHPAWMPKVIAALTLLHMLSNALGIDIFFTLVSHPVSVAFLLVSLGIRLLFLMLLVLIAIWGIRLQGREGWLALPAVVLLGIAQFQNQLRRVLHIRVSWFFLDTGVTLAQLADMVLLAVIFALLLRRLMLSLRHQREMALDVKQAQEVQRVLIPEALPHVPGLTIESEYRPAREVGGDFFQILPNDADGSVLIVIGDVTGKGLQAGMLVALIVGAIRSTAQFDPDPLVMLRSLNQRLRGRGHAHATCLALRIAADGAVTLANAGHLPPYLNGKELPMEGALPLGMMDRVEFSVMHFQLAPGDRLMLMSDGVAEAQDEQGKLFGFERIDTMLRKPITAAEVASAAQSFGQEDDISVLSVTRTAELKAVLA